MKRSERHHLKENEVARSIARAVERLNAERRRAAAVIVALIIVGAAVAGFFIWRQRTEDRASAMLAAAMAIHEAPVTPPAADPKSPPAPGSYPNERAKLEAALPRLLATAEAYPRADAGVAARYHAANILSALGRRSEAEQRYQQVIDSAGSSLYGQMAKLGMAETRAQAGQYDSALTIYRELSTDKDGRLPLDAILLQLGRTYLRAGKKTEAAQAFNRIVEEFPQSLFAEEARREAAALRAAG